MTSLRSLLGAAFLVALVAPMPLLAQARQQPAQQQAAFDRTVKERGARDPRRGGEVAKLQKGLDEVHRESDQLSGKFSGLMAQLAKARKALEDLPERQVPW